MPAADTSSEVTRASNSRAFGPAIAKPSHSLRSARIATPSGGRCASNQRR